MSSKLQLKPLLAKHHLNSEHSLIANTSHPYSSYEQELESNLRIILKRFHNLDKLKVRNLLEELDNNLELAIQILEEEMQSSNQILEEKKLEGKKLPHLTQQQENQILKQSFLNLYKKVYISAKGKWRPGQEERELQEWGVETEMHEQAAYVGWIQSGVVVGK